MLTTMEPLHWLQILNSMPRRSIPPLGFNDSEKKSLLARCVLLKSLQQKWQRMVSVDDETAYKNNISKVDCTYRTLCLSEGLILVCLQNGGFSICACEAFVFTFLSRVVFTMEASMCFVVGGVGDVTHLLLHTLASSSLDSFFLSPRNYPIFQSILHFIVASLSDFLCSKRIHIS